MQQPQILTHQPGKTYSLPHFFILNKGINSGKPLKHSCPNCFVCLVPTEKEKEFVYWIVYGLSYAKEFHQYLKGSVILFITLNDLKQRMLKAIILANENIESYNDAFENFKKLERLEELYLSNLKLAQEAKRIVFLRYIKSRR